MVLTRSSHLNASKPDAVTVNTGDVTTVNACNDSVIANASVINTEVVISDKDTRPNNTKTNDKDNLLHKEDTTKYASILYKEDSLDVNSDTDLDESDDELQELVNQTAIKLKTAISQRQVKAHGVPHTRERSELSSSIQCSSNTQLYINVDPLRVNKEIQIPKTTSLDKVLEKSVLTSDLEKKHNLPPYEETMHKLKKDRQKERERTAGKKWFDLPATEMTEQKKNDLELLHMRRVLDPKRFYKGNDMKALPKYFQMAKVVDNPVDFYHARIPKKQRKSNMVEELLADSEFRSYNKRKYSEIQSVKMKKQGFKAHRHAKKLKKNKR